MKMTYLVTVDVERESGMNASRDEVSDELEQVISEAVEAGQISSVGPRGDSEYFVSEVDIMPLQKKEEREVLAAHDRMVAQEHPGDPALREELRKANQDLKEALRTVDRLEDRIADLRKSAGNSKTRIWTGSGYNQDAMNYLPDGRLESNIYIDISDDLPYRQNDRIVLEPFHQGTNNILVRSETAVGDLAVMPQSGNVFLIRIVPRE